MRFSLGTISSHSAFSSSLRSPVRSVSRRASISHSRHFLFGLCRRIFLIFPSALSFSFLFHFSMPPNVFIPSLSYMFSFLATLLAGGPGCCPRCPSRYSSSSSTKPASFSFGAAQQAGSSERPITDLCAPFSTRIT